MNSRETLRPYPIVESHEILSTDPFYDALDEAIGHHMRMVQDSDTKLYRVEHDGS